MFYFNFVKVKSVVEAYSNVWCQRVSDILNTICKCTRTHFHAFLSPDLLQPQTHLSRRRNCDKTIANWADSLRARGHVQIQSISCRELALLNKLSSQRTNLGQFFDVLTPTFPLLRCRLIYRGKVHTWGAEKGVERTRNFCRRVGVNPLEIIRIDSSWRSC